MLASALCTWCTTFDRPTSFRLLALGLPRERRSEDGRRRSARCKRRLFKEFFPIQIHFSLSSSSSFCEFSRPVDLVTNERRRILDTCAGAMASKQSAVDLAKFVDKGVHVKLAGGREGKNKKQPLPIPIPNPLLSSPFPSLCLRERKQNKRNVFVCVCVCERERERERERVNVMKTCVSPLRTQNKTATCLQREEKRERVR